MMAQHQNQVLHDSDTYRYDQADRQIATLVPGVRQVALTRDALDRVVARTDTDLVTGAVSTVRYGFAGGGDVVLGVYDTSNNLLETTTNPYRYVTDPIDQYDLNGLGWCGWSCLRQTGKVALGTVGRTAKSIDHDRCQFSVGLPNG